MTVRSLISGIALPTADVTIAVLCCDAVLPPAPLWTTDVKSDRSLRCVIGAGIAQVGCCMVSIVSSMCDRE